VVEWANRINERPAVKRGLAAEYKPLDQA